MEQITTAVIRAEMQLRKFRKPFLIAVQTSDNVFKSALEILPFEKQEEFFRARAGYIFKLSTERHDPRLENLLNEAKSRYGPKSLNHNEALYLYCLDSYAKGRIPPLVTANSIYDVTHSITLPRSPYTIIAADSIKCEAEMVAYRAQCFAALPESDALAMILETTERMSRDIHNDDIFLGFMKLDLGHALLA